MTQKQYRLVTRSDFDGLVCAVLLKHLQLVDEIVFVHPKDMQDGKVEISNNDITTNLPYVPGVHLAFDHHYSETLRNDVEPGHIIDADAPSAARVVFDHYGGFNAFPAAWADMLDAVDKADSAMFTQSEILYPNNWVLLNFIMDARTGLGRFRDFTISNYDLMMKLIDCCSTMPIEDILLLEDVQERVEMYQDHSLLFMDQIRRNTTVYDNLVVLNLQEQD
ncbi:MAG: exopolyphosphatase, partial [Cellvibrionaceae bacterium]|nr:exopolyphosphatase [Cellvibrionaceae bacterium]